jgi:hypothetical protein
VLQLLAYHALPVLTATNSWPAKGSSKVVHRVTMLTNPLTNKRMSVQVRRCTFLAVRPTHDACQKCQPRKRMLPAVRRGRA